MLYFGIIISVCALTATFGEDKEVKVPALTKCTNECKKIYDLLDKQISGTAGDSCSTGCKYFSTLDEEFSAFQEPDNTQLMCNQMCGDKYTGQEQLRGNCVDGCAIYMKNTQTDMFQKMADNGPSLFIIRITSDFVDTPVDSKSFAAPAPQPKNGFNFLDLYPNMPLTNKQPTYKESKSAMTMPDGSIVIQSSGVLTADTSDSKEMKGIDDDGSIFIFRDFFPKDQLDSKDDETSTSTYYFNKCFSKASRKAQILCTIISCIVTMILFWVCFSLCSQLCKKMSYVHGHHCPYKRNMIDDQDVKLIRDWDSKSSLKILPIRAFSDEKFAIPHKGRQ